MKMYLSQKLYLDLDIHRLVCHEGTEKEKSYRLTIPESNILLCLLKKRNSVVKKDELIAVGWESQVVGSNSLNVAIYRIRKYLSEDNTIELSNVPKIGYKLLIEEVQVTDEVALNGEHEAEKEPIVEEKPLVNISEKPNLDIGTRFKAVLKRTMFRNKLATTLILLLVNIFIVQGYVIVFSSKVDIKCIETSQSITCASDEYNGVIQSNDSGISVLSNLFSFHKEEKNRSDKQ